MFRFSLLILLSLLAGCSPMASASSHQPLSAKNSIGFITVSGTTFLDPYNHPIIFHGINICNKSQRQGYTDNISSGDFALIRSWGMNAVRLCIFWDGLEPRPGHFNTAYLNRIADLVNKAKQQGLYVLLDMHQDLYSIKFGDGAPLWATLDDGRPHANVRDWNDAYYVSEDVQAALDHFWNDSPAPDGVGLQEHYAEAWRLVATRFRNEPAVLGYDLMNEPFPGRDAGGLEQAMLTRLSKVLRGLAHKPHPSPEELIGMEGTPQGRRQIISWLSSLSIFRTVLDAGAPIMQAFDRAQLMPMYSRVRRVIRQVDRRHILFLEPDMSTNLGIRTAITSLVDEDGKRDPQQAYSPHVYDIVVDTTMLDLINKDRISLIVNRDRQVSAQTQMPMLVGEWGAFYLNPAAAGATKYIAHLFDRAACSEMFWAYRSGITRWSGLNALKRNDGRY